MRAGAVMRQIQERELGAPGMGQWGGAEGVSWGKVSHAEGTRSNPGLILLREGTILNKWSGRDLPDISDLKERDLTAYCINKQQSILENYLIWIFILGYAALLFFYLFQKHKKAYFRNSK